MNILVIYAELMKWEEAPCRPGCGMCGNSATGQPDPLSERFQETQCFQKREELYDVIMREAVSVGIGMRSPERIDEINILQATYEAMREAVSKLEVVPQLLPQ